LPDRHPVARTVLESGCDVSKQVVDDARTAYQSWKEATQGSYVERVLADAIVRDIVPALIHAAERKHIPLGFEQFEGVDLETATEVAEDD
jgi:hypothetical protein